MKSQSFFASGEPQDYQCNSVLNTISIIRKYHPQVEEEVVLADRDLRAYALKSAKKGDYTDAITLLSQLINRHPQNAVDYNNRGLIYFQSGDRHKAFCDYNMALQINPKLASAYNNRANYYAAYGELAAAIADYDQALDLNPSYVRGWINRAITLRELGQYAEAIENLEVALLFGQLESHILAERGRTYHLWGDWNCAIADYQRALITINAEKQQTPYNTSNLHLQVQSWLNELMGFSN
ncbi:tetratricopeptide repeat protein [Calothrix rhizosoleniae]|uniref:tetratricopeptide repeat protein n=1 Tax=Calothrix rhizosoleniae TaxID=888997 RepID=UPI000B49CFFF|nr:tetratricopeptide repeat protein [Calothrix rhizosoleniae]